MKGKYLSCLLNSNYIRHNTNVSQIDNVHFHFNVLAVCNIVITYRIIVER